MATKKSLPFPKNRIQTALEIVFGLSVLAALFFLFSGRGHFVFFLSLFFIVLLMLEYLWYQLRKKIHPSKNRSRKPIRRISSVKKSHKKILPAKKKQTPLPANLKKALLYHLLFLVSILVILAGYVFSEWITAVLGIALMGLSLVAYRMVRKSLPSSRIVEKKKETDRKTSSLKQEHLQKELDALFSAQKTALGEEREERKRYKALQKKINAEERKHRFEQWRKKWAERRKQRKARREQLRVERAKKRLEQLQKEREKLVQKEKTLSEMKKTRDELSGLQETKLHIQSTSKYQTDLDRLMEMVQKYTIVKLSEAATIFQVSIRTIEDWARILESHNLIRIHYPAFGEPELRKVNR